LIDERESSLPVLLTPIYASKRTGVNSLFLGGFDTFINGEKTHPLLAAGDFNEGNNLVKTAARV
jgi:hypothetical protein